MNSSLDVLADSLDMKIATLKEIEEYNEQQRKAFEADTVSFESFDSAIEEKDKLINKLEKLDDGFESMYKRLEEELKGNKEKYADKIKLLQEKIAIITELSVQVQASEARNKRIIEQYFAKERGAIKKRRVGSKAAFDYYKSMSGADAIPPQFMDSKN